MGIPIKPSDDNEDLILITSNYWGGTQSKYSEAQRESGYGSGTLLGQEFLSIVKNWENEYTLSWLARANLGIDYLAQLSELYTDNGTVNNFVLTINSGQPIQSYTNGLKVRFFAKNTNTGNCSINIQSIGSKNLKTEVGLNIPVGKISSGQYIEAVYDSSNDYFVVTNLNVLPVLASEVSYTNTESGLTSDNIQSAIDEIAEGKANLAGNSLQIFNMKAGLADNNGVVFNQFSASLTQNGYQKLPSGLIIQWGKTTRTSWTNTGTSSYETLNLPSPFSTAGLFCLASQAGISSAIGNTAGVNCYFGDYSGNNKLTKITVQNQWDGGALGSIPWIAIGY